MSRARLLAALLLVPMTASAGRPTADVSACVENAARQPRTVFEVVVSTYPTIIDHSLGIPAGAPAPSWGACRWT